MKSGKKVFSDKDDVEDAGSLALSAKSGGHF